MTRITLQVHILVVLAAIFDGLQYGGIAFSLNLIHIRHPRQRPLFVFDLRDADFREMIVGGERYEMVPLPDSIVETTLFVGNLCEFVKDTDLSDLFQSVSKLSSLPACVVRKASYDSLEYGFVTFPSVEEKEVRWVLQIILITNFNHSALTVCQFLVGCSPSLSWP